MSYRVEWEQDASEELDKLDAPIVQRILMRVAWIAKNFDYIKPQALAGSLKGYFKLKVGHYRVIYTVDKEASVIVIEDVGHRNDIYKIK